MRTLPFFLSLVLTSTASAAPAEKLIAFCPSATKLQEKADACENNDEFIEAGEDCLDKLDAEIKHETKRMQLSFSADKGGQQKANFSSATQDYAASSLSLAALILKAELATKEIGAYPEYLLEPEDAEEADVNEGNLDKYLQQIPCYGEAKRSLGGIKQDFEKRVAQLQAAKALSDQMLASAGSRGSALSGGAVAPAPKDPAGKKQTLPAGDYRPGQSDISGTKDKNGQDEKKR
jgi:hypothetical protein